MNTLQLAAEGAWNVLSVALILGAGVPLVFAMGVRALAIGADPRIDNRPSPLGRILAVVCFGAVVLAVSIGIAIIVAGGMGKKVSFDNVYPVFVDKK